jgi:hypothetical protein
MQELLCLGYRAMQYPALQEKLQCLQHSALQELLASICLMCKLCRNCNASSILLCRSYKLPSPLCTGTATPPTSCFAGTARFHLPYVQELQCLQHSALQELRCPQYPALQELLASISLMCRNCTASSILLCRSWYSLDLP